MIVCAAENEMNDLIFEMLLSWNMADFVMLEKCLLKFKSESKTTPRFLASLEQHKPWASRSRERLSLCLFGPNSITSVLSLLSRRKLFDIQEFMAVSQSISGVSVVDEDVSNGSMDR